MKGRRLDWLIYHLIHSVAYRYRVKVLAATKQADLVRRAKEARAAREGTAPAAAAIMPPPPAQPPLSSQQQQAPAEGDQQPPDAASAAVAAELAKGKGPSTPEAARAALAKALSAATAAVDAAAAANGPAAEVAACNAVAAFLRTAAAAVAEGPGAGGPVAPLQRGSVGAPLSANPNSLRRVGPPSGAASRKKNPAKSLKGVHRA